MHRIGGLYKHHFHNKPRERLFLASLAFFIAYAVTRLIAHAIRAGVGPFRNVTLGQTHVHHLVWGIFILLLVGYGWLVQLGTGRTHVALVASRVLAILYGVGAALTLDEFALWLRLEDVYWTHEGRLSVDITLLFGALISAGVWGGPFLRAVTRQFTGAPRRP